MAEAAVPITPAPMEGHGVYNRSSQVQAAGSSPALSLLEQGATQAALAPAPEPITIADYGSSQGHNSLAPMHLAIAALRRRAGPTRAISVVHTDLPDNDFAALFRVLAEDPESYQRGDPMVFASAIGRSFYEQLLPAASVTLGWSAWAIHWLSRVPAQIPDHIQVAFCQDGAAREAFARQAAEDWQTFLACRGREVRPGGRLVLSIMALDEVGGFGYGPVVQAIYDGLLALVEEGFVATEEVRRMAIPTTGRSLEALRAPFKEGGHFAGLVIEHLQLFLGEDRIWAEYERSRDAQAFAARWAAFSRASVFPTLAAELSGGSGDPRAGAFMDRLEANMIARLAVASAPMEMPLARMLLVREGG
ncbi:MAG TPA: hypothetical protein VKB42_01795 [Dongiaceae bacterium]|nr:hypothetical protein [Dongiaceae bacterium]